MSLGIGLPAALTAIEKRLRPLAVEALNATFRLTLTKGVGKPSAKSSNGARRSA